MVIYVRCRSYGTWFPRTGRSSSLRGFSPIAIIRRRTTACRVAIYFRTFRTPRRCDLYAERISRLFSRHGGMYVPHPRDTINQRHLSYERRFTRRYIGRSCRGKSVASLTRYAKVCSPMERIESEAVPCARFVFAGRNARPAALRQLNKFPRRELTYNWHEIIVS